MKARNM